MPLQALLARVQESGRRVDFQIPADRVHQQVLLLDAEAERGLDDGPPGGPPIRRGGMAPHPGEAPRAAAPAVRPKPRPPPSCRTSPSLHLTARWASQGRRQETRAGRKK